MKVWMTTDHVRIFSLLQGGNVNVSRARIAYARALKLKCYDPLCVR